MGPLGAAEAGSPVGRNVQQGKRNSKPPRGKCQSKRLHLSAVTSNGAPIVSQWCHRSSAWHQEGTRPAHGRWWSLRHCKDLPNRDVFWPQSIEKRGFGGKERVVLSGTPGTELLGQNHPGGLPVAADMTSLWGWGEMSLQGCVKASGGVGFPKVPDPKCQQGRESIRSPTALQAIVTVSVRFSPMGTLLPSCAWWGHPSEHPPCPTVTSWAHLCG